MLMSNCPAGCLWTDCCPREAAPGHARTVIITTQEPAEALELRAHCRLFTYLLTTPAYRYHVYGGGEAQEYIVPKTGNNDMVCKHT